MGHSKKPRILLLDPPSYRAGSPRTSRHLIPNIGLAYIAAVLRQAGFDVGLIDPVAEGISPEDCLKRLDDFLPDIVGLSAMTHNITQSARFANDVKSQNPGIMTVLGGVHITAIPEETMAEYPQFDVGVFGEGEVTSRELFQFFSENSSKRPTGIKNVIFRDGNNITKNEARAEYVDLETLPFPAWDMFPLDQYVPIYNLAPGTRQLPISTSRGCPFNCVFCNNVNGHEMRYRNVDKVLDEIYFYMQEYGVGSLQFVDESLTFNMERAEKLFDGMISRGHGRSIQWVCQTRIDRLSATLLSKMKESGCRYISVGIESGNRDVVSRTGKNLDLDKVRDAVDQITRSGIVADTLFLIGLPYDNTKTILDTIRFARSLNTKHATFSNVVPFPGTMVHEMGKTGEGGVRLLTSDWSQYERHIPSYAMELESVRLRRLKFLHFFAYVAFYFTPGRIGEFFKKVNPLILPGYLFNMIRTKPGKTP